MKAKEVVVAVRTSSSYELQTLLAAVKKPGKKGLFFAVSLECGLFTGTVADAF
jgi:hypothetical protein